MCSLGAAGHLDVVGLLGALGAPRLAGAPERLLRPEEEEDDRREDRQVDGGGEPVLFIRVRRVLVKAWIGTRIWIPIATRITGARALQHVHSQHDSPFSALARM